MRTFKVAALALTLGGCSLFHETRYVTIHCLTKEQFAELQKQKPEKIRDQLTGKADEDVKKISGRLIRVEAWGDGLLDVLGGCV
jgi:hypothetical protein